MLYLVLSEKDSSSVRSHAYEVRDDLDESEAPSCLQPLSLMWQPYAPVGFYQLILHWGEIEHWHDALNPDQVVDGDEKAALIEQTKEQYQTLTKIIEHEKCRPDRREHYRELRKVQGERHRMILDLPQKRLGE